ncbi:MAG: hypothetical protein VW339_02385, partial [Quisquiliibacterium sp.]
SLSGSILPSGLGVSRVVAGASKAAVGQTLWARSHCALGAFRPTDIDAQPPGTLVYGGACPHASPGSLRPGSVMPGLNALRGGLAR